MTAKRSILGFIEQKKLGGDHSDDDIGWIVREYTRKQIPDYQMAAWLMAVRLVGMTERETYALTRALVGSGASLEWPRDRPVVDKHSTGGVGDKTSVVLVPLLASAGLTFVKMSGRGLGHTGGTLDKLESIPGFRVDLSIDELKKQVDRIGCALVGQSPELVPADGVIYALRDVTGTVDSVPLIASSIMSKKLAAGARSIVLDVKYGSGAFMRDQGSAAVLARAMVRIGEAAGRGVRALLSPMNEPLGAAVGNALEIREAIETLTGAGPADLRALTVELGAHLMVLSGAASDFGDAALALSRLLDGGLAADHFEKLIAAQGGDPGVVSHPYRLPAAPAVTPLRAGSDGWIHTIDARVVAEAALRLGAGRQRKKDPIDPRVGVRLLVAVGDPVTAGQPVAEIHAADASTTSDAASVLRQAIRLASSPPERTTRSIVALGSGLPEPGN